MCDNNVCSDRVLYLCVPYNIHLKLNKMNTHNKSIMQWEIFYNIVKSHISLLSFRTSLILWFISVNSLRNKRIKTIYINFIFVHKKYFLYFDFLKGYDLKDSNMLVFLSDFLYLLSNANHVFFKLMDRRVSCHLFLHSVKLENRGRVKFHLYFLII